jgi:O-methyltransferase involved in polyketide biosynthesis
MLLLIEALERHRSVTIVLADDLGDHNGQIRTGLVDHDSATVFIRRDGANGEQRAATVHELLHLICPALDDQDLEMMAARMLVPAEFVNADLVDVQEIADQLCVDPQLVLARMRDAATLESTRHVREVDLGEGRYGTLEWSSEGPHLIGKPLQVEATGRQTIVSDDPRTLDLMTDRAHSARVYDYLLGGKTNYAADRQAGDAALAAMPSMRDTARAQRAFVQRAARFAAEAGIDQFLDIGTGIPTEPNLHQIAQDVNPDARVVYVDNDPIVLAHAAALMGGARGSLAYVHADAREPAAILGAEQLRATIDLTRPVAVSVIGIVHFLDDDTVHKLISTLMDAVPSGSYLSITVGTFDLDDSGEVRRTNEVYARAGIEGWARTRDQVRELLAGLDVVPPGIVQPLHWRPGPTAFPNGANRDRALWAAVARKP